MSASPVRRLLAVLFVCVGFSTLAMGCASGIAPAGDDDDEKFTDIDLESPAGEAVAVPPTAATQTPRPSLTPVPPTATRVPPTTTPTSTPVPPTPTPTPVPPTPTPTPMFAPEVIETSLRVAVGERASAVVARDIDAEIERVELLEPVAGLSTDGNDAIAFAPEAAGTWSSRIRVTDTQGLTAIGTVELIARHDSHPNSLIALGDSVASGHGLDLVDYINPDPCWRSSDSYPRRVFNALRDEGVLPAERAEFALLACSGHDVDDLWEQEVTGGFADIAPASGRRSQLDWAVRSNPRFVTLTIGANDTGFVGPAQLFLDDGVTLDRDQVDRRMAVIRRDLDRALTELVAATDATVFVTNYYNPAAERPQGIATCRLDCFRAAADEVVGAMNQVIEDVARSFPDDRVVFIDIATTFIGKGAPNGFGLDSERENGFGVLGSLIGADQIADVHPYCARGDTVGASWINALDCVHPDERGTEELAAVVAEAIRRTVAAGA